MRRSVRGSGRKVNIVSPLRWAGEGGASGKYRHRPHSNSHRNEGKLQKEEYNQGKQCTNGFGIPTGYILFFISYRRSLMYSIHTLVVMKFIAAFA